MTTPAMNTRDVAVNSGPSAGASTRMKMNDAPHRAASAIRRATSAPSTCALPVTGVPSRGALLRTAAVACARAAPVAAAGFAAALAPRSRSSSAALRATPQR